MSGECEHGVDYHVYCAEYLEEPAASPRMAAFVVFAVLLCVAGLLLFWVCMGGCL